MASRLGTGSPQVGQGEELDVISAVILGGTNLYGGEGRMFGTLLGAMIIGTLLNGMTLLNVSPYVQMVIRGLVILGAVCDWCVLVSPRYEIWRVLCLE